MGCAGVKNLTSTVASYHHKKNAMVLIVQNKDTLYQQCKK
jgi:hypothetical protein